MRDARHRSRRLAIGVGVGVLGFGAAISSLGTSGLKPEDDGFFGRDTSFGGADKTGHALSTHIQTALYAGANRRFGLPVQEAALRGAVTAWGVQLVVELGDGFSEPHGFSWRDLSANTLGALFGYAHEVSPRFGEIFDYRWEYLPSHELLDEDGDAEGIFTDYEGSAYVLAANVGALAGQHREILDFVDLQLAYKTRGYIDQKDDRERLLCLGVGISLPTVFKRLGLDDVARVFEYYQPPGTSLRWCLDFDD